MYSLCSGIERSLYHSIHIQVAVFSCRRTYAHSFVRYLSMERSSVSGGIYSNAAYSQFTAGSYDADCYLASVGDEYFSEHFIMYLLMKCTYSALSPSVTTKVISHATAFSPPTEARALPVGTGRALASVGGESSSRSYRTALTDDLNFEVEHVTGNYLTAELCLVDTAEETNLALEFRL